MDQALKRVLDHGRYIMGPEVPELERRLAAYCGAKHVVSCANGTDALELALMAKGIGSGDAVLVPSFTFCATAEAVAARGATPVFIDVQEETFNLDPATIAPGIAAAVRAGLRPAAILPVDLFGLPADYDQIARAVAAQGLCIIADAAQSFGAKHRGRMAGALAEISTTSFFPAKPLGCYGDGGAIMTDDDALAGTLRSLRAHGQGGHKYEHNRIGMNSRLDTIQAAVLLEKLKLLPEETDLRDAVARRYCERLRDVANVPTIPADFTSVWAQFTLRLPGHDRDAIAAQLKEKGVPTAVYYPKPLHQQPAYKHYPVAGNGLPVSERLSREVLSLPMHPYLDQPTQDRIVDAVRAAL
jgi:dTDP-4-amino-4,6-dideoxygalactose transaminase